MDCLDEDVIVRLALGELDGDRVEAIRAHLDTCQDCRALVAHVRRTSTPTRAALEAHSLGEADTIEDVPSGVVGGRYQTGPVLGSGGMGFVLAASDRKTGERVAIKFMHANLAKDVKAVVRFEREARAMSQLRSPHSVRVLDVGVEDSGAPYLVMEFLEGMTLAALLGMRGPLPWREAVGYLVDACAAIAEANAAGIIHRDIKPQNLFLAATPTGNVLRVLDFGLAKSLEEDASLTMSSRAIGTPQYMAPEQIRDSSKADFRTDVWSLGATLYRLVTAAHAFPGANAGVVFADILHTTPVRPLIHRTDLPPELDGIIMSCLERDPAKRYASARVLGDVLGGLLAKSLGQIQTANAVPSAAPLRSTRVYAMASLALAAMVVATLLVFARPSAQRVADPRAEPVSPSEISTSAVGERAPEPAPTVTTPIDSSSPPAPSPPPRARPRRPVRAGAPGPVPSTAKSAGIYDHM